MFPSVTPCPTSVPSCPAQQGDDNKPPRGHFLIGPVQHTRITSSTFEIKSISYHTNIPSHVCSSLWSNRTSGELVSLHSPFQSQPFTDEALPRLNHQAGGAERETTQQRECLTEHGDASAERKWKSRRTWPCTRQKHADNHCSLTWTGRDGAAPPSQIRGVNREHARPHVTLVGR